MVSESEEGISIISSSEEGDWDKSHNTWLTICGENEVQRTQKKFMTFNTIILK